MHKVCLLLLSVDEMELSSFFPVAASHSEGTECEKVYQITCVDLCSATIILLCSAEILTVSFAAHSLSEDTVA